MRTQRSGIQYIKAHGYRLHCSTTTVHKSAHAVSRGRHQISFGANARMICDMSGLDSNSVVLVGGQDGDLASPQFLDQVDLWRRGDMIPLPLSAEGQRARTVLTVRLSPAPGGRAGD